MKSFRLEPHKDPKDGSVQSFRCDREEQSPLWSATDIEADKEEKKRLIKLAERRAAAQTWFTALTGFGVIVITLASIIWLDQDRLTAIVALVLVFALALFHDKTQSGRAKRNLSKLLLEKGLRPKSCLMCGYNLRGSTSPECPECGEALALTDETQGQA